MVIILILTCARKPTWVGLIYRTESATKNCKTEKLKSESRCVRSNSKSLGNHVVSSEEEKERLQWEGFAGKEGFKSGVKERVGDDVLYLRPGWDCITTLGKLFTPICLDADCLRYCMESLNRVYLYFWAEATASLTDEEVIIIVNGMVLVVGVVNVMGASLREPWAKFTDSVTWMWIFMCTCIF